MKTIRLRVRAPENEDIQEQFVNMYMNEDSIYCVQPVFRKSKKSLGIVATLYTMGGGWFDLYEIPAEHPEWGQV